MAGGLSSNNCVEDVADRESGERVRVCTKPGCTRGAVATLTYDYHDSTAVLGPLATSAQPHTYDLCDHHAENLTVPRGWQVVRLQTRFDPAPPSSEDLLALVEVIRDVAGGQDDLGGGRFAAGSGAAGGGSSGSGAGASHSGRGPSASATSGDPSAKYAPLRRREHLTVISGAGGDVDDVANVGLSSGLDAD